MLSQIQPALFDLAIHIPANQKAVINMDISQPCGRRRDEMFWFTVMEMHWKAWASDRAQFPHAFRKYDAGYFGYPM